MARAERPHIPHIPIRPRDLILATVAFGGLAVAGGIVAEQSGVFANGSGGDDEGRNRIVAPLPTQEQPTLTPLPTNTQEPTFTPTPEPTETPVPPTRVVVVQPTPRPVQPTGVSTRESVRIPEGFNEAAAARAIARLNEIRASRGLNVLQVNESLNQASRAQLQTLLNTGDIPDNLTSDDHNKGGSPTDRAKKFGYNATWVGEVIAVVPFAEILPSGDVVYFRILSGADVVNTLMTSPAHQTAMMEPKHKDVGAACWIGKRSVVPIMVMSCVVSPAY